MKETNLSWIEIRIDRFVLILNTQIDDCFRKSSEQLVTVEDVAADESRGQRNNHPIEYVHQWRD